MIIIIVEKKGSFKPDLELKTKLKTVDIMSELRPYEDLCWELARLQLLYQRGHGNFTIHEICEKTEEIFEISPTNEEICSLISLHRIILEEKLKWP